MHQSLNKFLEAFTSCLVELGLLWIQLLLKDLALFLFSIPLFWVKNECACSILLLSECFAYIFHLVLVSNKTEYSVLSVLSIESWEFPNCIGHDSIWESCSPFCFKFLYKLLSYVWLCYFFVGRGHLDIHWASNIQDNRVMLLAFIL